MSYAIRHPKRGKAHKGVPARDLYTGRAYTATACGLPKGTVERMATIPVEQVAPTNLCRTCWPRGDQ